MTVRMVRIPAASRRHRGVGVGRGPGRLRRAAQPRPGRTIQLELLVPREWQHPANEFLKAWYGRHGYRVVRTATPDQAHPQLAPLLPTPCAFHIYEKGRTA